MKTILGDSPLFLMSSNFCLWWSSDSFFFMKSISMSCLSWGCMLASQSECNYGCWMQSVFTIICNKSIMADVECVFESMTGKGSIFISNFTAATNVRLLHKLDIRAILSVARSGRLDHSKQDIPLYLYIPAQDHADYQLYRHFNQTFEFIDAARRETNVLVHCMAGVSRSVTIVLAYLLKKYKCSLSEVIKMVQRKRHKINPNQGFIQQLKMYAQQEGLKCDYDALSVPSIYERSLSRKKRTRSVTKSEQSRIERPNLTPILAKKIDTSKYYTPKMHTFDETPTSITVSPPLASAIRKSATEEIEIQELPEMPQQPILIKKSLTSAPKQEDEKTERDLSCDRKSERKASIEEKINRIRERMILKQELRRGSLGNNSPDTNGKENNRSKDKQQKQPVKDILSPLKPHLKYEEYLSMFSKKQSTRKSSRCNNLRLKKPSPKKELDLLGITDSPIRTGRKSPTLQPHKIVDLLSVTNSPPMMGQAWTRSSQRSPDAHYQ